MGCDDFGCFTPKVFCKTVSYDKQRVFDQIIEWT